MIANGAGWFDLLILLIEGALAVLVGYLFVLTLAALAAARRTIFPKGYTPRTRFAILVPAHNEERLLPELLNSFQAQNYPSNLFDVFIVADNCSDQTGEIGRAMQARVYERTNTALVGKGHALNLLYDQMHVDGLTDQYAAYVIFDADTMVDRQFLRVMDARLQNGETIIQGYYSVRNPDRSWNIALRYAALAVLHYLRPMGRSILSGTAGLKGNGMCFSAEIYKAREWSGSVTEDIEYHMNLVLTGHRVSFAPDARLTAEMPGSLNGAYTQNMRWESGRWKMARQYALPLLKMACFKPSFVALDALMEHLIPPTALLVFSLVVTSSIGLLIGVLSGIWGSFWLGFVLLTVMAFYLWTGLFLVHAPKGVWLSLLYTPQYVIWKLGLILHISVGKEPQGWVRTGR